MAPFYGLASTASKLEPHWGGSVLFTTKFPDIPAGVYSSTNWPLFTGGQNSILNRVLKLNPLSQKIKK